MGRSAPLKMKGYKKIQVLRYSPMPRKGTGSPAMAIAVDIGATNLRVGLISEDGCILRRAQSGTPVKPGDPGYLVEGVISRIRDTIPDELIRCCRGIGISAAGPVDPSAGAIVNPPNIPITRIPVVEPIRESFRLPVRFWNDCFSGAMAEARFGAGKGCACFVYLTLSTGIGAGVFDDRRLLLGSFGNFAEVGHFTVDTRYDLPCGCGGTGHWEAYGSGRFIPSFFRSFCEAEGLSPSGISQETAKDIFSAADQGNPAAIKFIEILGRIQATGLSSVISAYDPGRIILDGSVVHGNWRFFETCTIPHVRAIGGRMPGIVRSPLRGDAPLLGAALAVFESMGSAGPRS